ncbi:MAG: rhomboid family intramembrane serine protease [Gloeobacteraceae cyanobacterium ES-bin-144]|nr:rhomboid family intramembrane serine protease [Verrucomicrobiales bacterium]
MHSSGGPFSNMTRNLAQLRSSPSSWLWFAIIIVVQLLVESAGGVDLSGKWFETFGLSRDGFFAGNIWQILSYGFLHGNWTHAGVNALFILLIGSRIEFMLGWRTMMCVTFVGVIAGGFWHLLIGVGLLVGLSGGCLALLLLLTTLSPQSRMFPLAVSAKNLGLGILLAELVLALMNPALAFPGFENAGKTLVAHGMGSWFQVGHACHFGGALAGWIIGRWILWPRVSLDRLRRDRARREAK